MVETFTNVHVKPWIAQLKQHTKCKICTFVESLECLVNFRVRWRLIAHRKDFTLIGIEKIFNCYVDIYFIENFINYGKITEVLIIIVQSML